MCIDVGVLLGIVELEDYMLVVLCMVVILCSVCYVEEVCCFFDYLFLLCG